MLNTRLYKILSQLSAPKLNRFWKFISSPYFNKNGKITQLIDILINVIKKEKAVPEKKELWTILSFEGEYNDVKFRKLCNDCVERFENYLIIEELNKNNLLRSNLLLNSIKKAEINELIEKHIAKSRVNFDRILDRSSDYFIQKFHYQSTLRDLKSNYEKVEDINRYVKNNTYQSILIDLEVFYVIEKLKYAIEILTLSKNYKIEINIQIESTLQFIRKRDFLRITPVKIYFLIYTILSDTTQTDLYYDLKQLAINNIYSFPLDEQSGIFDALFSFCIRQINSGDSSYLLEYLELNEWGISERIILKNGFLSETSFRNFVGTGLRVGQFDRVENYINSNIYLLEESRQENALNFNLARVAYYRKNFEDVLTYLNKVNYDDIWYNINSKNYLLVVYYEMDELDVLESTLESFAVFLRREKSINENFRSFHINFTKYLRALVKNGYSGKEKLTSLKNEISEQKNVGNKKWLLEKIDELL